MKTKTKITAWAVLLDNERIKVTHQTGHNAHYRIDVKAPYELNGQHERYYIPEADYPNYEFTAFRKILQILNR